MTKTLPSAFSESRETELPSALENLAEILNLSKGKELAVFLDYDGTLTPIVERPEDAVMAAEMRQTLQDLANYCTVAVVSGRDLQDVQNLVNLKNIIYAGSHGFEIMGYKGQHLQQQKGQEFLPVLDRAEKSLREGLEKNIEGVQVERKKFAIAVHYRRAPQNKLPEIEKAVNQVQADNRQLRKNSGKKIFELQPDIDWNKGKALLWLLDQLNLNRPTVLTFYLGDDVTDEDAFKALQDKGIGIVVQDTSAPTAARYRLQNPKEVIKFLRELLAIAMETQHG